MNKDEKIKKLKDFNSFLIIIAVILLVLLVFKVRQLNYVTQEKEDLCYISNRMIRLINNLTEILETDSNLEEMSCYEGDARFRYEEDLK